MKPCFVLLFTAALGTRFAHAATLDTARIEQLTGLKGTWNAEEAVFKVTAPRTDVPVAVDGRVLPPFLGLTSWAAFMAGKNAEAVVSGDLVLLQDEVNPVMSAALEGGLSVTALHNHFFFDEPRVYFMHIGGEGALAQLADGVKQALAAVHKVRQAQPMPAGSFSGGPASPARSVTFSPDGQRVLTTDPTGTVGLWDVKPGARLNMPGATLTNAITVKPLEDLLGQRGQSQDGMAKFVVGRKTKMACGCQIGKEMGVNTWAAFGGTDEDAVVAGDFAVLEDELQPVLKSLRWAGLNIVAIHHHMTHETQRMLFLHYWGRGKAADLAHGLKKTLDLQSGAQ
jgi:hypothetical protein